TYPRYYFPVRILLPPIPTLFPYTTLFRSISLPSRSNFVVLINSSEKIAPNNNASITSVAFNLNSGIKNITAPVLINMGGKIIFLDEVGFLYAFARTNIIVTAIKMAITLLATINIEEFKCRHFPHKPVLLLIKFYYHFMIFLYEMKVVSLKPLKTCPSSQQRCYLSHPIKK